MSAQKGQRAPGLSLGMGAGVGGGLGLVFGLLVGGDAAIGLVFGAAIGIVAGLLMEAVWRSNAAPEERPGESSHRARNGHLRW